MPKRVYDGLKKRCECGRRKWAKCSHPWYFTFCHGKDSDGRKREFRFQLTKQAGKPADYVMSKTEAEALRDELRSKIRTGAIAGAATAAAGTPLTLDDVTKRYLKIYARSPGRRPRALQQFDVYIGLLQEARVPGPHGTTVRLGNKPLDGVTKADLEALWAQRLAIAKERQEAAERAGRTSRQYAKGGQAGVNRLKARARHFWNWAIENGYTRQTPFKRDGINVIRVVGSAERARDRRLVGDEEDRLLKACDPFLRALVEGALETACRLGELLELRWRQVNLQRGELALRGAHTKTSQPRTLPITARLRAILELRRLDPEGDPLGPDAYVFGNEVGERRRDIRGAWHEACAAAGIEELHFHDLRREGLSRLLEAGVPLHVVRDWAGHTSIATTSRYLSTTIVGLQAAARQLEKARGIRTSVAQQAEEAALLAAVAGERGAAQVTVN